MPAMHNGDEKAKLAYDIFLSIVCKIHRSGHFCRLEWCRCHHLLQQESVKCSKRSFFIINGISWFGCKVDPEKNAFELSEMFHR